jgi:hypothetical protein
VKSLRRYFLLLCSTLLLMGAGISSDECVVCGCTGCWTVEDDECGGDLPTDNNPYDLEAVVISPFANTAWTTSQAVGHHTPFFCPPGGATNCFAFDANNSGYNEVYFDVIPAVGGHEVQGVVVSGGARETFACGSKVWREGGYRVVVDLQVRTSYWEPWYTVGRVAYVHLSDVSVYNGEVLARGRVVGQIFNDSSAVKTSCWGGRHLHVEFQSEDGHSPCYAGVVNSEGSAVGSLDRVATVGGGRNGLQQCDFQRGDTRGGSTPEPEPSVPECVAGTTGYVVSLCDGSFGIVFANPDGTAADAGACCFQTAAEASEWYPDLTDATSWGCFKSVAQFPCRPACAAGTAGYSVPLRDGRFGVTLADPDGTPSGDSGAYYPTAEEANGSLPNLTDFTLMFPLNSPADFTCHL